LELNSSISIFKLRELGCPWLLRLKELTLKLASAAMVEPSVNFNLRGLFGDEIGMAQLKLLAI
jgi:hypothetical protein